MNKQSLTIPCAASVTPFPVIAVTSTSLPINSNFNGWDVAHPIIIDDDVVYEFDGSSQPEAGTDHDEVMNNYPFGYENDDTDEEGDDGAANQEEDVQNGSAVASEDDVNDDEDDEDFVDEQEDDEENNEEQDDVSLTSEDAGIVEASELGELDSILDRQTTSTVVSYQSEFMNFLESPSKKRKLIASTSSRPQQEGGRVSKNILVELARDFSQLGAIVDSIGTKMASFAREMGNDQVQSERMASKLNNSPKMVGEKRIFWIADQHGTRFVDRYAISDLYQKRIAKSYPCYVAPGHYFRKHIHNGYSYRFGADFIREDLAAADRVGSFNLSKDYQLDIAQHPFVLQNKAPTKQTKQPKQETKATKRSRK